MRAWSVLCAALLAGGCGSPSSADLGPREGDPRPAATTPTGSSPDDAHVAHDPAVGLLGLFAELGQVASVAETSVGLTPAELARAKTDARETSMRRLAIDDAELAAFRTELVRGPRRTCASKALASLTTELQARGRDVDDYDAAVDADSLAAMKSRFDARIEDWERELRARRRLHASMPRSPRAAHQE